MMSTSQGNSANVLDAIVSEKYYEQLEKEANLANQPLFVMADEITAKIRQILELGSASDFENCVLVDIHTGKILVCGYEMEMRYNHLYGVQVCPVCKTVVSNTAIEDVKQLQAFITSSKVKCGSCSSKKKFSLLGWWSV